MGRHRTWTTGQLRQAVPGSRSVTEIIERLGLQPCGQTRQLIRRHADQLNLTLPNGHKNRRRRPTERAGR